jgi:nitroreductase
MQMISEIIKSRRSVFPAQYNDEAIKEEEIKTILAAANWAPTHRRTEPWRFKVIQGETKGKLADFLANTYKEKTQNPSEFKYNKYKKNPRKAACVIAICMQRNPEEVIPEWEEIAATAMAVQNMWLVAHEMKIGAYWGTPGSVKYMGDFFELKEGERCLGFFYMGKYDNELIAGNRNSTIEEKTVWL